MNLKSLALLLILSLAGGSAPAARPDPDAAKATWVLLHKSFGADRPAAVQGFLGKTIVVSTGRHELTPVLVLAVQERGEKPIIIRLVTPAPRSRMERAVRKVQRYPATFLEVNLTGIIRSIDFERREIVVEPLELTTGSAI